jgi:hypothetical protein
MSRPRPFTANTVISPLEETVDWIAGRVEQMCPPVEIRVDDDRKPTRVLAINSARLWWPVHTFWTMLRFIGIRDRLRCPRCRAVGTWKPHGSFLDHDDTRKVRRWLCKWCGFYVGPEGELDCVVDPDKKCWVLPWEKPDGITPSGAVAESSISRTWPWRG